MPECSYCEESFDSEAAELDHLRSEHAEELGPIDRRRVGMAGEEDGGFPTGPVALGVVLVAAAAVVGYVVFAGSGGGAGDGGGPTDLGSVHYHGTINMTVDGQQIDFGRPTYQRPRENPAFHFEGGDGSQWHAHAQGVTLQFAMETLDIELNQSTVVVEGETYRDTEPDTSVTVQVNGNDVDPAEYVLRRDDHIRIVVRTDA